MSTRCTIHFAYGFDTMAIVYRHHDGYPDGEHGIVATLNKFFDAVEAQTADTRFGDPTYLAAKFVVYQAAEYSKDSSGKPLDFLSVGVCTEDPGDIAYRYLLDCKGRDEDGRPTIFVQKAYEEDEFEVAL
jgi:hypothetical protein